MGAGAWCGPGGIFQKTEHRCGHMSGSCSCLTAFPVPPPPTLSPRSAPAPWLPGRNHKLNGQGALKSTLGVFGICTFLSPLSSPTVGYLGEGVVDPGRPCCTYWGAPENRTARVSGPRSSLSPEPQMDVGATAQSTPPSQLYHSSRGVPLRHRPPVLTESQLTCPLRVPRSLYPHPFQKLYGSRSPGRQMRDQISLCQ